MFDIPKVKAAYKNLIGWRPHFDNCITVNDSNKTSESGDYYQDKFPPLRLDYIMASLTDKQDINKYIAEKVEVATVNVFNDVLQKRQVEGYGKTLLEQVQLLNRPSFLSDKIVNQSRFVGFQIKVKDVTGLQVLIDQIGLQLDGAQETINIYLFHSSRIEPLKVFEISTLNSAWVWKSISASLDSMDSEKFFGGVFILGYYQNDLTRMAINYSNFDWNKGECQGCGTSYYSLWKSVQNHFHIYPIYWPEGNYTVGEMPDLSLASYDNAKSWGLNLKLTVRCDLTFFFVQNRFVFKNLLGYQVALLILNDMQFSTEINSTHEQLRNMIIRTLEGDKETNALNLPQQYSRELKAVSFNISDINRVCLGCIEDTYQPVIGVV